MATRKIPFAFLCIANLIFLAHAIIPHHHHHSAACISSVQCSMEEESHSHDAEAPHHEHNQSNKPENCALKQLVVVQPTNNRGHAGLIACDKDFVARPEVVTTHDWPGIFISVLFQYISDREIPDFSARITGWLKSSHGLRAPPLT